MATDQQQEQQRHNVYMYILYAIRIHIAGNQFMLAPDTVLILKQPLCIKYGNL